MTDARQKRAEAREGRRRAAEPSADGSNENPEPDEQQPLDTVVQAAKIAAAGAAVGAAAAAARALASHHDEDGKDEQDEDEAERADEADGMEGAQDEAAPAEEERSPQSTGPSAEESQESQESPSQASGEDDGQAELGGEQPREPVDGAAPRDAKAVVDRAREQLGALLERQVEEVSALERTHDGWVVVLEVVELARIPESTDVLASYEMELDEDLNLRRYQQVRRYNRSQAGGGEM